MSYDNGSTWKVLENGLAEGINTGSNPISNATVDGDNLKLLWRKGVSDSYCERIGMCN